MKGYGQFCPVAQAAEVLTERWTPLVIRELALVGSRRFNDIQRGVPLMSSSLLTKRLRQLERAGLVERRARLNGKGTEYHLTPGQYRMVMVRPSGAVTKTRTTPVMTNSRYWSSSSARCATEPAAILVRTEPTKSSSRTSEGKSRKCEARTASWTSGSTMQPRS